MWAGFQRQGLQGLLQRTKGPEAVAWALILKKAGLLHERKVP
jgi:hypothetical protein